MNETQLDVIGTLYTEPTEEGATSEALPGWHVNATAAVAAWVAYRVTPATPRRIFAGVTTYYYTFPDKETFTAEFAVVNLQVTETAYSHRRISRLAFLSRFTDAEAVAFDLASQGATVQAAGMRRYMKKIDASTYIDLDRSDTRSGVLALESAGLLAPGRAVQILDNEITEQERWHG